MSEDVCAAVQIDEDTPPEEAGEAVEIPLRYDAEGQAIYADWPEDPTPEDIVAHQQWAAEQDAVNGAVSLEERAEEWAVESTWSDAVRYETPAEVKANWDEFRHRVISQHFDRESLLEGVEKSYSTSQAAAFFGRSNQWMYWGLRKGIFTYKDGTPILPERVGKMGKRRFTLPLIREIALSCFRRGNMSEEELESIMAKILLEEFGEKAFANTKR